MYKYDILILSNGPGELATWVRPVVRQVRSLLLEQDPTGNLSQAVRISLVLSPCPHATGKETAIARGYQEIDRVQAPQDFMKFLLTGKTAENWQWCQEGVVLFLGGDQIFPVIIGKRLQYKTVVYAEWSARWWQWIDQFALMRSPVADTVPAKYQDKLTIIGDLMADVVQDLANVDLVNTDLGQANDQEIIGLLPGSKPAKLSQGLPLTLAIADYVHQQRPNTRFILPMAPTLDFATLAKYAGAENPMVQQFGNITATLQDNYLVTNTGLKVTIHTENPAYGILRQCRLCITTVGANTAELGSLAVPMLVLLPTQELDAMRAWDGLPGILARLPGVGSLFAKIINTIVLRQGKLFAWPNIWAGKEIVPELVGKLQPNTVGDFVLEYLANPTKLQTMGDRLRQVRGEAGASKKLAKLVIEQILSPVK
jgi:lipid-A-disaccharide synthase